MSTNVCTFVGRLGDNPEITLMPNGKERVRFSIAVDRNYKREDGSRPTDWIPVVIWGSANYVKKTNLHKGDKITVKINGSSYTKKITNVRAKTIYVPVSRTIAYTPFKVTLKNKYRQKMLVKTLYL